MTIIALRNELRLAVNLARQRLDGLYYEACNGTGTVETNWFKLD